MAIRFDSNTEYVDYASSSLGSGESTIVVWMDFYLDQVPPAATNYVLLRQLPASTAGDAGFYIFVDDADGALVNLVRSILYNNPQPNYTKSDSNVVSGTTWHTMMSHLTRNFASQEIEVDGVDVENVQVGANFVANTWTDTLTIAGVSGSAAFFDGAIGEVAVAGNLSIEADMRATFDAGWSLDVYLEKLSFYAPMLTGTAELRGLTSSNTGTPSPEPGPFRIHACEPQTFFAPGSGGGGGGGIANKSYHYLHTLRK